MKIENFKLKIQDYLAVGIIILFAVILRLVPHPPNIAPIAALALFGGVYLDKRLAIVLPLFVMILSDAFIGFHNTILFVYGSFVLTGLLGLWVRSRKSIVTIGGGALISSLLFFLITNFGVWMQGTLYPKTIDGLWHAYVMGLPFLRNTMMGDLFYAGVLFGGYEVFRKCAWIFSQNIKSQASNSK